MSECSVNSLTDCYTSVTPAVAREPAALHIRHPPYRKEPSARSPTESRGEIGPEASLFPPLSGNPRP
eukprot:1010909-Prorocentrum_minimum.AAC.1